METRRLLTTHSRLAELASERIIVGRFATLADAVRAHEGRTRGQTVGSRPHDEALYGRARKLDG
jgi:hypothetical protein